MRRFLALILFCIPGRHCSAASLPDALSGLKVSNCQTVSTNSTCATKTKCQLPGGGKISVWTNPQTGDAFAFLATSHHFIDPNVLLEENLKQEFKDQKTRNMVQKLGAPATAASKKQQSVISGNVSAHLSKSGRYSRTKVMIHSYVPACFQPGDLQ